MTIKEKLQRIKAIPKRIVEIERNRSRLAGPQTSVMESTGASQGTPDNSSEARMINYSSDGTEIAELRKERQRLIEEVQDEIDRVLGGDSADDIDKREIIKSKLLDGDSLKYIGAKVVHRDYTTTKRLFKEGCEQLGV